MKQLCLFCVLSAYWFTSISQCAVSQSKGSHSTTYINKFEEVLVNKDFENGANKYELRLVLNKDTNSSVPDYVMMQCRYTNSGNYRKSECAPRAIMLEFTDGKTIGPIWALTEDEQQSNSNGSQSRTFQYEVSQEIANCLRNVSVKHIYFTDKRTKNLVDATPYQNLLKEQLECLAAISSKQ